jgi:hypothetical protein
MIDWVQIVNLFTMFMAGIAIGITIGGWIANRGR